ncbi:MAG: LO4 [Arowana adomavirus]|uniref:LO4 n=1 Tax=Arowana adomavirus TaxID=2219223 RepID=A0A2U9Q1H7_9VIRU|nr:MAG: LO4 [Arowana adomavirus]
MAEPVYGEPRVLGISSSQPSITVNVPQIKPEIKVECAGAPPPVIHLHPEVQMPEVIAKPTIYVLGNTMLQFPEKDSIVVVQPDSKISLIPVAEFIEPIEKDIAEKHKSLNEEIKKQRQQLETTLLEKEKSSEESIQVRYTALLNKIIVNEAENQKKQGAAIRSIPEAAKSAAEAAVVTLKSEIDKVRAEMTSLKQIIQTRRRRHAREREDSSAGPLETNVMRPSRARRAVENPDAPGIPADEPVPVTGFMSE